MFLVALSIPNNHRLGKDAQATRRHGCLVLRSFGVRGCADENQNRKMKVGPLSDFTTDPHKHSLKTICSKNGMHLAQDFSGKR